ncbi:lipopolysaccharide biosynthesis protein [Edaphocola flava]|uniref:lipopolysaccharide biosynthesis protein n=1 Tax=Edaphocola flava TaxID=2499629 RepID=UPI00100BC33C|nr:oligosaccharide flippase family protein [Edaphocola flava]
MKLLLKNKNLANSFWNLLDIFLYPIVFFVSVPLFIKHLGPEAFGVWMLLNTILVGMQVFNFGLGPGILKNIAWQIGKGDREGQISILNSSLSASIMLFLLAVLITGTLALLTLKTDLFSIGPHIKSSAALCIALTGALVGFRFMEQVFTNFCKAYENFRAAAFITINNRLAPLIVNLILLFYYPDIATLVISMLVCNALTICCCFLLLHKRFEGYRFRFKVQFGSESSRFALVLWLQSLCMILIFQADRYLIVQYFGLVTLSYYALTATIFNHLHMGFNALLGWVAPKFTKWKAQDIEVKHLYIASRDSVLLISVNALLLFHFLYPYIFPVIMGVKSTQAMTPYINYFIIMELFLAPSIIPAYFLNASGHEKGYLYFLILFALGTVTLMLLMLHYFKAPLAVVYALVLSNLAGMIFQNLFAEKQLFSKTAILRQLAGWILLPIAASLFLLYPTQWWGILSLIVVCLYSVIIIITSGRAHATLLYKA